MSMQCEHQMKRTSVAVGQAHPVWKEEVNFKSVQITSDLQVDLLHCLPSVCSSYTAPCFDHTQSTYTVALLSTVKPR